MGSEPLRHAVQNYVQSHYPGGQAAVYWTETELILILVANKFNPSSFW